MCISLETTLCSITTFWIKEDKTEGNGSSEEDQDNSGGETELPEIDPRAEDRELKNHLLKKYSGYLSSLKQELSKKKKKGKLPKEARQKLLNWWELHYKWPYPSVRVASFFTLCLNHEPLIKSLMLWLWWAGIGEGGVGRIDGFGPETDKQLVHQPKETPLEAFGGYAVYGDGWSASPQCSPLHGGSLYGRRALPVGAVMPGKTLLRRLWTTWSSYCCLWERSLVMFWQLKHNFMIS